MLSSCVLALCVVNAACGNIYSGTDYDLQAQRGHYDLVKSIVYAQSTGFQDVASAEVNNILQDGKVPVDEHRPFSDVRPRSTYIHKKVPYKVEVQVPKPYVERNLTRQTKLPAGKGIPEYVTAPLEVKFFDVTVSSNSSHKGKPDNANPNYYSFEKQFSHEEKVPADKPKNKLPFQYHIENGVSYLPGKKIPKPRENIPTSNGYHQHYNRPKDNHVPQVKEPNEFDNYFSKHFLDSGTSEGINGGDYQAGLKSTKIRQEEHNNQFKNFTSPFHYSIGTAQGQEHHNGPIQVPKLSDSDSTRKQQSIKSNGDYRNFQLFRNTPIELNAYNFTRDHRKIYGVTNPKYQHPSGGHDTHAHNNHHSTPIAPTYSQHTEAPGKVDTTYAYPPEDTYEYKHISSTHDETEFTTDNGPSEKIGKTSFENDKSSNIYSDEEVKPWYGYNKSPISNGFSHVGSLSEYYSLPQPNYFGQAFDSYNPYGAYESNRQTWGPHNLGGGYPVHSPADYTASDEGKHRHDEFSTLPEITTQFPHTQDFEEKFNQPTKLYNEHDYTNMWKPQPPTHYENYGGTVMPGLEYLSQTPNKYNQRNFRQSTQSYDIPKGTEQYPSSAIDYRPTGNYAEPKKYEHYESSLPTFTNYQTPTFYQPLHQSAGYHSPSKYSNKERLPFAFHFGYQTGLEDVASNLKNMFKMSGFETADFNGPESIHSYGKGDRLRYGDDTISTDLLKYLSKMLNDEYSLKVKNANAIHDSHSSGAGRLLDEDVKSTSSWQGPRGRDDSAGWGKQELPKFQRFVEVFPVHDSTKNYYSRVQFGEMDGSNTTAPHKQPEGIYSMGSGEVLPADFQRTANLSLTANDRSDGTVSPTLAGIVTKHRVVTVRRRRIDPTNSTQTAGEGNTFPKENTEYSHIDNSTESISTELQKNLTLS